MFSNLKALIVVALIAGALFRLAKPVALEFSSADDFSRRRIVWFTLTAAREDTNPVTLYLLMLQ